MKCEFTFSCPECKKIVEYVTEDGRASLLHPVPAYLTYLKLTADDYVRLVGKLQEQQLS